jgi:hypothetical protein
MSGQSFALAQILVWSAKGCQHRVMLTRRELAKRMKVNLTTGTENKTDSENPVGSLYKEISWNHSKHTATPYWLASHWLVHRHVCAAGKRRFHFIAIDLGGIEKTRTSGHYFCAEFPAIKMMKPNVMRLPSLKYLNNPPIYVAVLGTPRHMETDRKHFDVLHAHSPPAWACWPISQHPPNACR